MELNIMTIYCYHKANGEKAFIYSVKTPCLPEQYVYYILDTNENCIPYTKRINKAINMLQMPSLTLTPIEDNSEEYYTFISSLAEAVHTKHLEQSNKPTKKFQKIPHPIPRLEKQ